MPWDLPIMKITQDGRTMQTNSISHLASLIGEPARTAMLLQLMDDRQLTASELARAAGVGASTASGHLAQLVGAGVLRVNTSGRHRYHRLASPDQRRRFRHEKPRTRVRRTVAPIADQSDSAQRSKLDPADEDECDTSQSEKLRLPREDKKDRSRRIHQEERASLCTEPRSLVHVK